MENFNLLQSTIETSIIIVLILVIRKLFKNFISPNIRYFLWIFAALRILVPFKAEIPVYLPQMEPQPEMNTIADNQPDTAILENVDLTTDVTFADMNNETKNLTSGNENAMTAEVQKRTSFSAKDIAFGVWIAGITGLSVLILLNNYKLFTILKNGRKELRKLSNGLTVYSVKGFNCLAGMIFPAIYIDADALAKTDVIENVIKHELQHYKVKDHLWQVLRVICLILQWYNPIVWWAYHVSKQDCEIACDYRTTKEMTKEERYSYSNSLLFAIKCSNLQQQNMYLTASMASDKEFVKERIQTAMAAKHKTAVWLTVLVVCILGIISAVSLNIQKPVSPANLEYQSFSGAIGDKTIGMIVHRDNDFLNIYCFSKSDRMEACMFSGLFDTDNNTFKLVSEDAAQTLEGKYYIDQNDMVCLKGNLLTGSGLKEKVAVTYVRSYENHEGEKAVFENFGYINVYEAITFVDNFAEAVQHDDTDTLAGMMNYPVSVYEDGNDRQIEDAHAFIAAYDSVITEETRKDISAGLEENLLVNWQGVHFGNIWFLPDSGITSINNNSDAYYQSDAYREKAEGLSENSGIEKDTDYGLEDAKEITELVEAFSNAYFAGDADALSQYLAESYTGKTETYPSEWGDYQIMVTKGLSDIGEKNIGDIHIANVEFKPENMEGYVYLYMELEKQEGGWKIVSYGLEL